MVAVVEVAVVAALQIQVLQEQEPNRLNHLPVVAALEDGDILEDIILILLRTQEQVAEEQVVRGLTGELAELHLADKDE